MSRSDWNKIYDILSEVYEDYQGTDADWGKAITKVCKELKRERQAMSKAIKKGIIAKLWDDGSLQDLDRVLDKYLKDEK